ncbi:hypothetical protein KN71_001370 [Metamycoplasma hominis]|uniref:Uncharacterized protein n=1 Tax=Metamycoplasma hominis TaxID=2098 RepID=A0A454C8W1_METHO|nr:hypothetical protein [Metamycoplasma hominis]AYN65142.1 hypothetical protein KN71_000190 [Metamycoplasma hominis]AYN65351.1 hypothetical protein KN71_001370 [Metamycoplasma hominis]
MTFEELHKDLDYWKEHEPQDVWDYYLAYDLADQEFKTKGIEAEGWAFDIEDIISINRIYDVEYIAINEYGRAMVISVEDAGRFFQNQEIEENESSKSSLSDFDKTPTDLQDSKVINEYNKSSHTPSDTQSKSKTL